MTADMEVLRRDYLPEELKPLLKASGFDGTIAVQARQMLEETDWLLKLADEHDFIKGVVGWVDLRSPQLHGQLERYAKHRKLAGVRHVLHDEQNDHFMLLPEFRRGIAQLRAFGLTYDLLLFPKHLPVAVELVARVSGPAVRAGPHRQTCHPRRPGFSLEGRPEAARTIPQRAVQTLRDGHGSEVAAMAAGGFPPLP